MDGGLDCGAGCFASGDAMSNAQRLYGLGVIGIEECCRRVVLERSADSSFTPLDTLDLPRFVRIRGGVGSESDLLEKIRLFPIPASKIGVVNIRVKSSRGGFSCSFHNYAEHRSFSYPGRFATREAAMTGARYLVWAINEEVERRSANNYNL